MGQQQLLLVILVTIIVGIATVVAINTFSSAADSANIDAARQDAAQIASSAQGAYMKPTGLGGAGQDFNNVELEDLTWPAEEVNGDDGYNQNGEYQITSKSADSFVLTVTPASCIDGSPDMTFNGCDDGTQLEATISEGGISWTN